MTKEELKITHEYELVLAFFKGDKEKTFLWFSTPNPNFGDSSPIFLMSIDNHRRNKVYNFIKSSLEENKETQQAGGR